MRILVRGLCPDTNYEKVQSGYRNPAEGLCLKSENIGRFRALEIDL